MKLEVGKYYKTRAGNKAKVLARREFLPGDYPFIVETFSGKFYSTSEDGRFNISHADPFDLIEEWREPVTHTAFVGFYEAYGNVCKCIYKSEAEARGTIAFCGFTFLGGKEVSITL